MAAFLKSLLLQRQAPRCENGDEAIDQDREIFRDSLHRLIPTIHVSPVLTRRKNRIHAAQPDFLPRTISRRASHVGDGVRFRFLTIKKSRSRDFISRIFTSFIRPQLVSCWTATL